MSEGIKRLGMGNIMVQEMCIAANTGIVGYGVFDVLFHGLIENSLKAGHSQSEASVFHFHTTRKRDTRTLRHMKIGLANARPYINETTIGIQSAVLDHQIHHLLHGIHG
mmetsp:Transcript_112075/g.322146  ORF Transcript_112075/g.322146 Transcript_112075/m.322146 type:complete len:109 (-) Transcript_112075:501-827(-)